MSINISWFRIKVMLVQTENTITEYNNDDLAIRRNLRAIRFSIIEIPRDMSKVHSRVSVATTALSNHTRNTLVSFLPDTYAYSIIIYYSIN